MFLIVPDRLKMAIGFLVVLLLICAGPIRSAERLSSTQQPGRISMPPSATNPAADADSANSIAPDAAAGDMELGHDGQPLTPSQIELGAKVRRTLALYEPKHLNARDNSSWEVMHGLIAFGPRTEIFRDGPGGQTVNAMGWLCWGAGAKARH